MILKCFFGFEDAVVENLFSVVQVHYDYCDTVGMNVKFSM